VCECNKPSHRLNRRLYKAMSSGTESAYWTSNNSASIGKFSGTIIQTSLSNEGEQLLQTELDEMHCKSTKLRETKRDALSVADSEHHRRAK
jgi:hypothetical protein